MTIPDGSAGALEVHRLLDEAFSGVSMTPARQDLKEEIRANLVARVAELRAAGLSPADAARTAVADLGDLRGLVTDLDPDLDPDPDRQGAPASPASMTTRWLELERRQRVRPRPGFLVRIVLLGAVVAAGLVTVALALVLGADAVPLAARLAAVVVVALAAAGIAADALAQETTTNHPMPVPRALGYGAALGLGLLAAGLGWQAVPEQAPAWLAGAAVPLLAGAVLATVLFATQTNRRKSWVLDLAGDHAHAGDRFTEDPAAAARFGIYTLVTWLVAAAAFVALTLTVGWAWSWLALVAALAATMLTLARMLFAPAQG